MGTIADILRHLACMLMISTCSAQIVVIQGTDPVNTSRVTINNNFSYLNTTKLSNPTTAIGDMIYLGSSGITRLAIGGNGNCLGVAAGIPAWLVCGAGTPGGSTSQLQYNNSGVFGGVSGATSNGTTLTLTNPIFINPALGTPASGVGTNFTGIPLATAVIGNLSVNNLNSGTSADNTHFWRGDGTWAVPSGGVGSGSWKAPVTVATLPVTCNQGDTFYVTDATVTAGGSPFYICYAANTIGQFGSSAGPSGALSASGTNGNTVWDIVPAVVPILHAPTTLTDGATVTWAMASVPNLIANLTFTVHSGSRTLNITGPVSGAYYTLNLTQDATGGEGLTLGTGCTWKVSNSGGGAVVPSTGANAVDILAFYYDGARGVCYANFNVAFN